MQSHITAIDDENREPSPAGLDEKKQVSGTVAGVDDPGVPSLADASVARRNARTTSYFAVAGCVRHAHPYSTDTF